MSNVVVCALYKFVSLPHFESLREPLLSMMEQADSFGFHGSIPSVVRYLGVEVKSLRKIMLLGSALPLLIYLLWQLGSQGVLSQSQLMTNQSLSGFINQLASVLHSQYLSSAISVFADLALEIGRAHV